jgi:Uma2 family endonuclease
MQTSEARVGAYRFTVEDFFRLGELGFFAPDARVELVGGTIYAMPPQGPDHADGVLDLAALLRRRLAARGLGAPHVREQLPVVLSEDDAPEPDVTLTRERVRGRHPRPADVLLVAEVAQTSLARDREVKRPAYAAAAIPELWIVDLEARRLEVYRDPRPAQGEYRTVRILRAGDEVTVAALPALGALPVAAFAPA